MVRGIMFTVELTGSEVKEIDKEYSYSCLVSDSPTIVKIICNEEPKFFKEFAFEEAIGNQCFVVVDDDNIRESKIVDAIIANPQFIESIDKAMYHLGFNPEARVVDPNFNGDITEIENTITGRHVKKIINVILTKEDRVVLSFRYCLSWYFTFEEKLPWYATEEAEVKHVLLGAYLTKNLKNFRLVKDEKIEKMNVIHVSC